MKRDLAKIFTDEKYRKCPKKYRTNKILYNHIDEIWCIYLADEVDNKISNIKGYRYIFVVFDIFSKYVWVIPLQRRKRKTVTDEYSNISNQIKTKTN